MILYGLKTCDTCRKAVKALEAAGQAVTFRDVRSVPLSEAELHTFLDIFGDRLVNRASTTWRGLTDAEKSLPVTELLRTHPALMKRPVIKDGAKRTLGWDKAAQTQWLG